MLVPIPEPSLPMVNALLLKTNPTHDPLPQTTTLPIILAMALIHDILKFLALPSLEPLLLGRCIAPSVVAGRDVGLLGLVDFADWGPVAVFVDVVDLADQGFS